MVSFSDPLRKHLCRLDSEGKRVWPYGASFITTLLISRARGGVAEVSDDHLQSWGIELRTIERARALMREVGVEATPGYYDFRLSTLANACAEDAPAEDPELEEQLNAEEWADQLFEDYHCPKWAGNMHVFRQAALAAAGGPDDRTAILRANNYAAWCVNNRAGFGGYGYRQFFGLPEKQEGRRQKKERPNRNEALWPSLVKEAQIWEERSRRQAREQAKRHVVDLSEDESV